MIQLKNKTNEAWNGDEYMQLKKRLGGLFLSIVIIFTGIIVNPLEVHAAGIEGYLAQADQYLAVDDPVQAMKVIVDAINTCGKDVRLVAKADDIRSHTFVTSKKVFMQNGELGVKPIPSEMVFEYEVRKPIDATGAWTVSTIGVFARTTLPSEDWIEYNVTSDVPADANGLYQSSHNRVTYDAKGRVSKVIERYNANISWNYDVPFAGGGGSENSVSSMGPYLVKEYQYDDLNRVTKYFEYYVEADETTKVFHKGYEISQYVYGTDGSFTEYVLSGASKPSGKLFSSSKVHRLSICTYNSAGQMIDKKFYVYNGEESWITIEECLASGQLLEQDTYTYLSSNQKEYNHMYKNYGEASYRTSYSLYERIGNDLEMDEQGNLAPSWIDTNSDSSYDVKRDAAGNLIQVKVSWSGGGETTTYTYNKAGKITEQTIVTRDGQFSYTEKKKVLYTSDGGYSIETFQDGKKATKMTFDRFGNKTQYLDYNDLYCDCWEENDTYNYDGSILSHVTIRNTDGNSWITGDFYEYDYFGNILTEALSLGQSDSWPLTYFYQYTYHYDPNHLFVVGTGH